MDCCIDIASPESYTYDPAPGRATLLPYLNRHIGRPKPAVIICPGGGYTCLAYSEGEPVARRFQAHGLQAFLLQYSIGRPYPASLRELAHAVSHVRENAVQYHVDPQSVFVCGFSAGGHLAASLAVHGGSDWTLKHGFPENCIPDGLILCYPVTGEPECGVSQTYQVLRRDRQLRELEPMLDVEGHVSSRTPRTFLWHNADDDIVSVETSLRFLTSLKKSEVPFEAHIFPKGGHMLSLADESTASEEERINRVCAQWFGLALDWIRRGRG